MFSVVVVLILAVFAAASFIFYRKAKQMEREQGGGPYKQLPGGRPELDADAPRTVTNLQVGDIVSYLGADYMVEGRLDYNDEGWTWITYMLVDGPTVRWLSVEEDDQLEVSLWDEADVHISGKPPEFIEYEGERFRMVEWGDARVEQRGKTGRKAGLNMEYFEYEGPGDRYLSVERWGNEIEVSVGEDINPYGLELYPGDTSSFA